MLQSWHALKLQLRQKRPSAGAGRAARCAVSLGCWRRLLLSSPTSAVAGPRPRDPGPGRASRQRPQSCHFAAAPVWGMRARWLQVAAEQLPVGEQRRRGGGSLGPK